MKKLGFGFMRLPLLDDRDVTSVDLDKTCAMADLFLQRGFSYFDTAYMYHDFSSEKTLRETVVKRYARDRFTVASKMPTWFLKTSSDHDRYFSAQLENCGIDRFDFYMMHNVNHVTYQTVKTYGSFAFLAQKKKEGKIGKTGFSFHGDPALLAQILDQNQDVDFVQHLVNYSDWNDPVMQSRKCNEICRAYGKDVFVVEPTKGGTLSAVPQTVETLFRRYAPDRSPSAWAIRFAASAPNVKVVLSGMSNLEQVRENTGFMDSFAPMSEEELQILAEAAKRLTDVKAFDCTGCGLCNEICPEKIPVSDYFALYNNKARSRNHMFAIQDTYYQNLVADHGSLSRCTGCGLCEKICPQKLKIRELLNTVTEAFPSD